MDAFEESGRGSSGDSFVRVHFNTVWLLYDLICMDVHAQVIHRHVQALLRFIKR